MASAHVLWVWGEKDFTNKWGIWDALEREKGGGEGNGEDGGDGSVPAAAVTIEEDARYGGIVGPRPDG